MNSRDINVFQAVAETKSITEASKVMYLSPQGVSKIIKNIEIEFGCELFYRSSAGLILTPSGKCFLEHMAVIADNLKNLKQDLDDIRQNEAYSVDLLSAYGIIRLLTPDCISAFKKQNPQVEFAYREYPDQNVNRYFKNGEGNIAFVVGDADPELYDITPIDEFPIMMLVNKNNPLSGKKSVTIEDLRWESLYIESSAFDIYHQIIGKCRAAGFEPNIAFEASGFSLCKKMVAADKGISVIVDFIFEDMKSDNVVMIPFVDGEYLWKANMITRKGAPLAAGVQKFKDHVLQWNRLIRSGDIKR